MSSTRSSVSTCFIVLLVAAGCGDGTDLDSVNPAAHAQSSQQADGGNDSEPGDVDAGEEEAGDAAAEDGGVQGDDSEGDAEADTDPELPCNVKAFFAMKCQRCHGPEAKNGTPLMNRGDLMATSKRDTMMSVIERVLLRVSDPEKPMPPMGKGEPASEADIAMLKAWVDSGMTATECGD